MKERLIETIRDMIRCDEVSRNFTIVFESVVDGDMSTYNMMYDNLCPEERLLIDCVLEYI